MEKIKLISFPKNFDFSKTNDDVYKAIERIDVTNVAYTNQTELASGTYTYNTNERSYMISPTLQNATNETKGYLRLHPRDAQVAAGDEIEFEFEVKCVSSSIPTGVNAGLTIDLLDGSGTFLGALRTSGLELSNEYQTVRIKHKVPFIDSIVSMRFLIGVAGSPVQATPFTVYIRDVNMTLTRQSVPNIPIVPVSLLAAGLGLVHFDDQADKVDNGSTMPTSGARDVTLKSGFYKYIGSIGGVQQPGAIFGNGVLLVLPYRNTVSQKYIIQVAVINGTDAGAGMHIRYYYNSAWTAWSKFTTV